MACIIKGNQISAASLTHIADCSNPALCLLAFWQLNGEAKIGYSDVTYQTTQHSYNTQKYRVAAARSPLSSSKIFSGFMSLHRSHEITRDRMIGIKVKVKKDNTLYFAQDKAHNRLLPLEEPWQTAMVVDNNILL